MIQRTLALASLLLICTTSCSLKRSFDPPLTAENDIAKLQVYKIRLKKERLQLWTYLDNKTEDTLIFKKGNYKLDVDGKTKTGAQKAFIRIDKGFRLPPDYGTKKLAIEFRGIKGEPSAATLRLEKLSLEGKEGEHRLQVEIPLHVDGAAESDADEDGDEEHGDGDGDATKESAEGDNDKGHVAPKKAGGDGDGGS